MSVVVETEQFGGEMYCPSCESMFPHGKLCPRDGARLVRFQLAPDPIIGREIDGRFTVLEKLGEGGMGAVYRAHQHSVDREVAIKVVHPHLVSDPETIKAFLREAKLTSKLNHPNAVGVLDFGQTDDGVFYLVIELIPGKTLDKTLKDEGVFAPARVVKVGLQICDALDTAHNLKIVHRDLKPANIMLVDGRRDFVKVLDFGLAKMLDFRWQESRRSDQAQPTEALASSLMGTPAFFPPERQTSEGDARSDLYSMGCVLSLLASGMLPFGGSAKEMIEGHLTQTPVPLASMPPATARVIDKLLAKNPDERYQTAAEAHVALEEAASLDGIAAYQSSPSIEQARISRRIISQPSIRPSTPMPAEEHRPRRRIGILIGVGAAAIAILLVIIATSGGRSESATTAKPDPEPVRIKAQPEPPPPPPEHPAEDHHAEVPAVQPEPTPAVKDPKPVVKKRPATRPRPTPTAPTGKDGAPKLPF